MSAAASEVLIKQVFSLIAETLQKNDQVNIIGFGHFFTKIRKVRNAANPRKITEKISVPDTRVARFKTSRTLKEFIKIWPGNL